MQPIWSISIRSLLPILFFITLTSSQERSLPGTVTYVAAGTVFLNVGRNEGVSDSATAEVIKGGKLIATLRLIAMSSKSSSWTGDESILNVRIGDSARVRVPVSVSAPVAASETSSQAAGRTLLNTEYRRPDRLNNATSVIDVVGRVGMQFYGMAFNEPSLSIAQTGLVVSLRARARDVPLKLELYANLREMSRGSARMFSSRSAVTSRLYRLSLEYDDSQNVLTAGRSVSPFAPTIGILDGVTYARRLQWVTVGVGTGFQPDRDLQSSDFNRKKVIIFSILQPASWGSTSLSAAYAKTWYRGASEREAINATASGSITDRSSFWASTDVDLRVTENGLHHLAPSLSLLLITVNWRVTDNISLSGGLDASRSVLPYSFAKFIPDSMTDRTLRSGLNLSGSVYLGDGLSVNAAFAPRMSGGAYAGEYNGSTSISAGNIASTGVNVRMQGVVTQSAMTSSQGYGFSAGVNVLSVDWNVRVQQIQYRMKSLGTWSTGTTVGLDVMVPIVRPLTLLVSADGVNGYGSASRSLFAELSYRF